MIKLSLPKYIIGILCNYPKNQYEFDREKIILTNNHFKDNNNISELSHAIKIINKYNINVIVGVIKDGKINKYTLDTEDYMIQDLNLKYRVDLEYMYIQIYDKNITEENLIYLKSNIKYKSITSELRLTYDE